MEAWNKLLEHAEPEEHLLQFYEADERPLLENISRYVREGLKSGEGVLLIAAQHRNEAVEQRLNELGIDTEAAIHEGRLTFVGVRQALAGFMRDGQPDWELFQNTIGATVRESRARIHDGVIRAYGEMVGVLWEAGQFAAAIRLEHYWNELRHSAPFKLFCAYPIDVLGKGFQTPAVDALLRAHTHLLPGESSGDLEDALNRAMDEVLGTESAGVRTLIEAHQRPSWAEMPAAERMILWLRNNRPQQADQIVDLARQYCTGPSLATHIH
jgi:hypothetical protein